MAAEYMYRLESYWLKKKNRLDNFIEMTKLSQEKWTLNFSGIPTVQLLSEQANFNLYRETFSHPIRKIHTNYLNH